VNTQEDARGETEKRGLPKPPKCPKTKEKEEKGKGTRRKRGFREIKQKDHINLLA